MGGKNLMTELNEVKVRMLDKDENLTGCDPALQQVFIIGSKGIPAGYGGFETFVEKLTQYRISSDIRYYVTGLGKEYSCYEHNKALCFCIKVPDIGAARAVLYDMKALKYCIQYCKEHPTGKRPIFYVLACRIGPFIKYFKKRIHKLGGLLYINPDGNEWKRLKWNGLIRKYWKMSEQRMVKYADLLICDSKNIEAYIHESYKKYNPKTTFIAYGSETSESILKDDDNRYVKWLKDKGLQSGEYYLAVGRFVPENNFEKMICEFMRSNTDKNFAIITTENRVFLEKLENRLHFKKDNRIKFTGSVYDQELLKKIRENAYGYIHGHEVGGTNPSLLEALWSTRLNLLLDVGFNREVGGQGALYWNKDTGNLAAALNDADKMTKAERICWGNEAKKRILDEYNWDKIVRKYERLFKFEQNTKD